MLTDPFNLLPEDRLEKRGVDARDVLFREGAATRGMYLSHDATVRLERVGPDGEPVTIHVAGPGQSFAEASVFAERYHCDATVTAQGQVVRLPKELILDALADPEFARGYTRLLSRQVQSYRQLLEITAIRSATKRVHAAMVAGLLDGPVTVFAARIGLTHEATYRALRALVREGRIENPARGVYRVRG